MGETKLNHIAAAVKDLAIKLAPGATFVPKYGGEVLVPDAGDRKTFVAGVFVYREHVSVEFSNGAMFHDPDGLLEGKGKGRRHLKLNTLADIDAKSTDLFLRQALGQTS